MAKMTLAQKQALVRTQVEDNLIASLNDMGAIQVGNGEHSVAVVVGEDTFYCNVKFTVKKLGYDANEAREDYLADLEAKAQAKAEKEKAKEAKAKAKASK